MNERILRLLTQAREYAWEMETHWSAGAERERLFEEKFAELIVLECCEVAHCNFHVDGLTLGTILKEHFGVEE